jgi:uncharacterized membrane protein YqjE
MSGDSGDTGRRGGLFGSLRRLGDSALGALQTRAELLLLDLGEAGGELARVVVAALAILACLQLAIVTGLLFLLLVVGDQNRVTVLGIAALLLLLAAVGGAWWLRSWLRRRPPMFGTTMAELRKDREWIRGRS